MTKFCPENASSSSVAGFTLLELFVALFLSGLVMTGLFRINTALVSNFSLQDELAEVQQATRITLDIIGYQTRMAGYIPADDRDGLLDDDIDRDVPGQVFSDGANEVIEEAAEGSFAFEADIDDDGDTETIRYALVGTELHQWQWRWDNATAQWVEEFASEVVGENIGAFVLDYTFMDGDTGIPDDADGDDTNDRDDVLAVEVTLSVHTEHERRGVRTGYNKTGTAEDGTCPARTLNHYGILRSRSISKRYTES